MKRDVMFAVVAFCFAATLVGAPATAQSGFEGVITAIAYADGQSTDIVFRMKGERLRMEMAEDGERGILVVDGTGRVITIDDAERVYYVLPPAPDADATLPDLEPLGRSETVAGHPCEYYRYPLSERGDEQFEACIATGLGFMSWVRGELWSPAEERRLRRQFSGGGMILKAVKPDGELAFLVTKIEATSVNDAVFAPPPGYSEVRMTGQN